MPKVKLECIFDIEMLLEDGEAWTLGCKNLEMLLEDGEIRPHSCKNYT